VQNKKEQKRQIRLPCMVSSQKTIVLAKLLLSLPPYSVAGMSAHSEAGLAVLTEELFI